MCECIICLEPIDLESAMFEHESESDVMTCCQCNIPFHTHCLLAWYEKKKICSCPHCGYDHQDCIYCEHIEKTSLIETNDTIEHDFNTYNIMKCTCIIISYVVSLSIITHYLE